MFSWSTATMCTLGALRSDSQVTLSPRSSTTSLWSRSETEASAAIAVLVDGLSPEISESTTWTRSLRARSDSAPLSAAAFIFLGVRWS